MKISILGSGNMAQGLAAVFAKTGNDVTIASRDLFKAEAVAAEVGHNVHAATLADAGAAADIVVLAVPYDAVDAVASAAGGLAGRIVIDITNPMTADYSALTIGHSTSAAEEIQRSLPQAKVVKAFNTVFASVLQNGGKAAGEPTTVFVASDDADARKAVAELATSAGFRTIATGSLASARYLEPVAGLNIALAYGLGHGTDMAPTWQGLA